MAKDFILGSEFIAGPHFYRPDGKLAKYAAMNVPSAATAAHIALQ
jgi:hypothetical protein